MTAAPISTGRKIRVGDTAHMITQATPGFSGRSVAATRKATGLNFPDKAALEAVAEDINRYDSQVRVAEKLLGNVHVMAQTAPEVVRDLHERVRMAATRAARAIDDMATEYDVLPEINRALIEYRVITDPKFLYASEGSVSTQLEIASVKVIDAARSLYRAGKCEGTDR